ncbi:MAG: hypothetical protein QXL10_04670 [Candidatus Bathyarchaeia archaeon]
MTMTSERPRKIYKLTAEGHSMLNFNENSLNLYAKKISTSGAVKAEAAASGASLPFHNISRFIAILAK